MIKLLCIKSVLAPDTGAVLAMAQKTYTLAQRAKCNCGVRDFLTTTEVAHPYQSHCIPGQDWLPSHHFVELNDPKLDEKPEEYSDRKPIKKEKELATADEAGRSEPGPGVPGGKAE